MTAPTTREELTDEDYRAIARAARRYYAEPAATDAPNWWVLDSDVADPWPGATMVHSHDLDGVIALNGRAAVAEHEKRRKR